MTIRPRMRYWFVAVALASFLVAEGFAVPANPFLRGSVRSTLVLNIAHAGAASLAPQNTLAAGRLALELGADVWGVDVRLTADGVFVLMHDESLDRTTDVEEIFPSRSPWAIADFTLDEIRRLDAGSWFIREDPFGQIAEGNVSPSLLHSYAGESVPTLREALDLVAEHGWLIDIEIKPSADSNPQETARHLLGLIEETGTADRAMISSFDHDLLRAVKDANPSIPVGALSIFAPPNPIEYLNDLGADVYLPSLVGFTESLLMELRDAGIGVHVWTYNTEDQLERLARLPGIAGIYTDYPQRLESVLERMSRADSK